MAFIKCHVELLYLSHSNALLSPLSIAPMIDWTYTHFRVLMRLLAPKALLYTEMQTCGAIQYKPEQALLYSPMEQPLALQIGGSDKKSLVLAAKMAEDRGFAEINLNLGCPSDRVQAGRFGACLMGEAEHVADCIAAMKQVVAIPVSAKTRIGIDHQDSYEFFSHFAHALINAGCDKLIVHARKAWLKGLSPKQNRTVPPLHYDFVYRIKEELRIPVVINGNIQTTAMVEAHRPYVDGVMIGRLACQNPFAIQAMHQLFFPASLIKTRQELMEEYFDHVCAAFKNSVPLTVLLKPILNFAHGLPNAKYWKEQLLVATQSKNLANIKSAIQYLTQSEQAYCI